MGNWGTSYGAEISLGVTLWLPRLDADRMSCNALSLGGESRLRLKKAALSVYVGLSLPEDPNKELIPSLSQLVSFKLANMLPPDHRHKKKSKIATLC